MTDNRPTPDRDEEWVMCVTIRHNKRKTLRMIELFCSFIIDDVYMNIDTYVKINKTIL